MGITEIFDNAYAYGMVRYFKGDRLFNEKLLYEFNLRKIKAKEIITFDAALMDMVEITKDEINDAKKCSEQIILMSVRKIIGICVLYNEIGGI